MARKLRVEYEGAIYHVLNRGGSRAATSNCQAGIANRGTEANEKSGEGGNPATGNAPL